KARIMNDFQQNLAKTMELDPATSRDQLLQNIRTHLTRDLEKNVAPETVPAQSAGRPQRAEEVPLHAGPLDTPTIAAQLTKMSDRGLRFGAKPEELVATHAAYNTTFKKVDGSPFAVGYESSHPMVNRLLSNGSVTEFDVIGNGRFPTAVNLENAEGVF